MMFFFNKSLITYQKNTIWGQTIMQAHLHLQNIGKEHSVYNFYTQSTLNFINCLCWPYKLLSRRIPQSHQYNNHGEGKSNCISNIWCTRYNWPTRLTRQSSVLEFLGGQAAKRVAGLIKFPPTCPKYFNIYIYIHLLCTWQDCFFFFFDKMTRFHLLHVPISCMADYYWLPWDKVISLSLSLSLSQLFISLVWHWATSSKKQVGDIWTEAIYNVNETSFLDLSDTSL